MPSTDDGFGIAWAVAHKLATDIQCFALFATHFYELTKLPDCVEGVVNSHVTAHTTGRLIGNDSF